MQQTWDYSIVIELVSNNNGVRVKLILPIIYQWNIINLIRMTPRYIDRRIQLSKFTPLSTCHMRNSLHYVHSLIHFYLSIILTTEKIREGDFFPLAAEMWMNIADSFLLLVDWELFTLKSNISYDCCLKDWWIIKIKFFCGTSWVELMIIKNYRYFIYRLLNFL